MSAISPEQWQELSPYLNEALSLPDQERAAWILSFREKDAILAGSVEELLREQRALQQERFLEQSPAAPDGPGALAGQTIGAYTLVSLIGQGGMGSVWLARRSDGRFERQAAVKFLSIAWTGGGCEERFKREGSILARLTHPHIAQLLDAGVSAAGQPYLVLEYVDGEPIDVYCDRQKLDIEARIRLFLNVLAAVADAHANLIVHRDIKPSNVLVTRDGQVKLLDFGIAKLLQAEGQPGTPTLLTREGGSALTPQYAAPEQVKNEPITTATDVYGLGVLLYVICTGHHPAGERLHSTVELVKAIVETESPRMSEVVKGAAAETDVLPMNAVQRATSPEKLRRRLRGDLDTIVAKTLKKIPHERYTSVTVLADDLKRYLRHEPISARPDSIGYRSARFLRRYWVTATAATVVIVSLSAGLYVANRERLVAQQRFGQLQQLSTKIFDLDRAIRDLPGSTSARQTLVLAALEYLDRLAPAARGDLDLTQEIAEGYWRIGRIQGVPTESNLGEPAKAEESLKRADQLLETVLASRPRNREALLRSGIVANDRMILAQEEHHDGDALAYAHKSAERLDSFLLLGNSSDSEKIEAAGRYGNIALANVNMHRYAEAVPYVERAIKISEPIPAAQYRVAQALSLEASALRYEGDLEGALKAIQQAKKLRKAPSSAFTTRECSMSTEYFCVRVIFLGRMAALA
jgi:serine/threonine protein kinase